MTSPFSFDDTYLRRVNDDLIRRRIRDAIQAWEHVNMACPTQAVGECVDMTAAMMDLFYTAQTVFPDLFHRHAREFVK